MKKILHFALGDISNGELTIAQNFINNLSENKYNNSIIIPTLKKELFSNVNCNIFQISKDFTPKHNRNEIEQIIKNFCPDLIILFDVYTFEYSKNWTGCNLNFLKSFKIPIATLDEYDYENTDYKIDYYGLFVRKLPNLIDKCDYILKNCPLNVPNEKNILSPNAFYYKVFSKTTQLKEKEKEEIRRAIFNISNDNLKIVTLVTSTWEVQGAYAFSNQTKLANWLGPIIFHYLCDTKEDLILVHIGKENWNLTSSNTVKYIHFENLDPIKFEKVIAASDLFVTYNLVSISLSKAIMLNTPAIVLNNQKIIDFSRFSEILKERPLWYQRMAQSICKVYPFHASLFGWKNFLTPHLKNNPYLNIFPIVDVFNYNSTLKTIKNVLSDNSYRENIIKKEQFFKEEYYNNLLTPENILDDIFTNFIKQSR